MQLPLGPIRDLDYPTAYDQFSISEVEYERCEAHPLRKICDALINHVENTDSKYLCICVPCYNEEIDEFLKTVLSLMDNMEFIRRKVIHFLYFLMVV
jgi:hypothetical protein